MFHDLRRHILKEDPEIDEVTLADTLECATSLHEGDHHGHPLALDDEAMASALMAAWMSSKSG